MIGGKRRGGDRRKAGRRAILGERRRASRDTCRRAYDRSALCGRRDPRFSNRRHHTLDRRKEWTGESDAVLVPGDLFDRIQEFVGDFCGEGEDAGVTEREANDLAGLLKMLRR